MPDFTFTRDIPDAPNNPSQDQPDMKVNNNSTDSILNVDHFGFNLPDGGLHRQVTLNPQGAPGFPNGGSGVYYADAISGITWPAYQNTSGAFFLATVIPSPAANGSTSLVGNLMFQWGQFTSVGTALPNAIVPFPTAFGATAFSVNCTILTTDDSRYFVEIYDITNIGFRAVTRDSGGSKTGGLTFCWMAVGVAP